MKKFRTYKKYSLVYSLERCGTGYSISIDKSSASGVESSSYVVNGAEKELKALLCRLWSCGVTPMSLVYILEDEGYIPQDVTVEEDKKFKMSTCLVHRKCSCVGKTLRSVVENNDDVKSLVAVGGDSDEM